MNAMPHCCVFLGALSLLGGCGLSAQQRTWLAEGRTAYDRGQYPLAVERLSSFLNQVQQGPDAAQALYVRGLSQAKLERRALAFADMRRCVDLAAAAEVTWRAQVVLGAMYFEDGRWELARQTLEAAAPRMPPRPPLDEVWFRVALCQERTGQWPAARATFRRIAEKFPTSRAAAAARRRILLAPDHFAIQCGAFANSQNAEKLSADLTAKGLSSFVRHDASSSEPRYVVLVGRYATYAEARQQLADVRGRVPDAVIWP